MSDKLLIANLLRVAKEDLDGARLLAGSGNRNAAYLCEQAAEKIIRAVLTSEAVHAGRAHLLNEMVDMIPDANPIKPALRDIEHLAAYATAYRYPSSHGRISAPPTGAALGADAAKVDAALQSAASHFGVSLSAANTPATKAAPIR